ncbi:MAG: hypothetical protein ACJ8FJ_06055, partial [Sphingomicrobium sp.]
MQPDSGYYLAIERARQGASSPHPKGMALPAHRYVEALDRGLLPRPSLFASRCIRDSHVTALAGSESEPEKVPMVNKTRIAALLL